jgi:hypothetical protein
MTQNPPSDLPPTGPATILRQLIQEAGNPHIDPRATTLLIQVDLDTWRRAKSWCESTAPHR